MRIALAQLHPIVGDVPGNLQKLLSAYQDAADAGAQLVVAPELALTGYPPRDLLDRAGLIAHVEAALQTLVARTVAGPALLVGAPLPSRQASGPALQNSAVLLADGQLVARHDKRLLPTYDVFDEARYFGPGNATTVVQLAGRRVGIVICEDQWNQPGIKARPDYAVDPVAETLALGVDVLVNLSASPWNLGKEAVRASVARATTSQGVAVVWVNQVGGNDELLFDGQSFALAADGTPRGHAPAFAPATVLVDLDGPKTVPPSLPVPAAQVVDALVMGVRDYFTRTGFRQAVLGLSGGIDSALTAAIAAEAIGPENVLGIGLPGPYSSDHSVTDARAVAHNLGIDYAQMPIGTLYDAARNTLNEGLQTWLDLPPPDPARPDLAEENLQARARGQLLMAVSNRTGRLLLTTGNKSEMAVGYCTLYGDMCGALSVISDLPKTLVYDVCHWLNRNREVIPWSTIHKPPSAELAPGQMDQDSLPPYEVLDAILEHLVERVSPVEDIIAAGFDDATVRRVARMVDLAEYKRRQAAPGLRVTSRAFGVGRRMPIAAQFATSRSRD